jgi:hypothetical protein
MNKQAASDLLCGLLDFIAGIPPAGSRPNLISARESGIFDNDFMDEQAINRETQAEDLHANRVARNA